MFRIFQQNNFYLCILELNYFSILSSKFITYIDCDVNCHRKCEKLMPNLCGVNQKLIVEALTTLKKGKFYLLIHFTCIYLYS